MAAAQRSITNPAATVAQGAATSNAVVAPAFVAGDLVKIARREQTAGDIKSQLYYPHLGGLSGRVLKVFGDEASVQIERVTLPEAIRIRHDEVESAMRQKWLDSLSEEARSKLGEKEKQFTLAYTVLVSVRDLEKRAAGDPLDIPPPSPAIIGATETERQSAKRIAREVSSAMASLDVMTGESTLTDSDEEIEAIR